LIHIHSYRAAPHAADEETRQLEVDRSGITRRGGDPRLQKVVDTAATVFRTPIAALTIIDRDRQWFAVRVGLEIDETPRAISFCAHAIQRPGEALIVPDARQDRRFAANPLVLFAPHIRFYAGVPLTNRQGYPLGALCIIDSTPREAPDLFELSLLAREAERLIGR
jgi:GAF domain-containing protein